MIPSSLRPCRALSQICRLWIGIVLWTVPVAGWLSADEQRPVPPDHPQRAREGLKLFREEVGPILKAHCLECHGGKSVKADFDLADRKSLMESGYVEDTAEASYLMQLIEHTADPHMPFKAPKMAEKEIDAVRRWIDLGAPYDKPLVERAEQNSDERPAMIVTNNDRQFWSFRPLAKVQPPNVQNAAWCRTPIDQFILAKQEASGVTPNDAASKRVLIRRAYFDLLGLPPTPEDVDTFVNDTSPEAWPKLIDRLLESQHYGERWARHWMDVARFAESTGYEQDDDRPNAYHYRDFLIQAFNADMPFDQFLQWQLAGDELAPDDKLALMATGFLGAGPFPSQLTEAEFESSRYDELDDIIATTGVAFLGLSIGCARCHDHKFDPIPAADYYRLASVFATTIRSEVKLDEQPEENARRQAEYDAKRKALVTAMGDFERAHLTEKFDQWFAAYDPESPPETLTKPRTRPGKRKDDPKERKAALDALALLKTDEQTKDASPADEKTLAAARTTARNWFRTTLPEWLKIREEIETLENAGPGLVLTTLMVNSEGLPPVPHRAEPRGFPYFYPEVFELKRGDVHQKQQPVQPNYLQVLMPENTSAQNWQVTPPDDWTRTSYRRASLANWLTNTEQGAGQLAARVIVNRLWQQHFGTGIVATPNDFGFPGDRPTHPELLDWLARDLVENGWQLKRMHKLMMTSSVYMQSGDLRGESTTTDDAAINDPRIAIDPENHFLWRRAPQRLEGEPIRDAMLAVSGLLDPTMYGPGTLDEGSLRRSVYFTVKRSQLIPMMMLFDWPEHLVSIGNRSKTTIAPQALMFLNSRHGRRYAEAFAERLQGLEDSAAIDRAYRLAFGRTPHDAERTAALTFLQQQNELYPTLGEVAASQQARVDLCQALLSLNEFVYIE